MANLDVSFLLSDPDFVDNFTVVRRTQTVNAYGETQISEVASVVVGSVQPASPDDMQRLPDSAQRRDAVTVYSGITLSADAYPDVVVWKGKRYQVRDSEDFGNYGDGYSKAVATLIEAGNG